MEVEKTCRSLHKIEIKEVFLVGSTFFFKLSRNDRFVQPALKGILIDLIVVDIDNERENKDTRLDDEISILDTICEFCGFGIWSMFLIHFNI